MTAKLYSFKNKLTPLIYQPQPTILSPNQTKKAQIGILQPELMASASAPKFQTISQSPLLNKNLQPQMTLTHEDNNPFSSPNDQFQVAIRPTQSRQVLYRPNSTNNLNALNPLNKLIPGMDPTKSTNTLRPVTSQ